jgi:large subunit ribosomal protein L35
MPKLKTRKSVAKRVVKVTGTGQLRRSEASAQHRTTGKSKRTKRESKMDTAILGADAKKIRTYIPYA